VVFKGVQGRRRRRKKTIRRRKRELRRNDETLDPFSVVLFLSFASVETRARAKDGKKAPAGQ
jgi:hypothetical protein